MTNRTNEVRISDTVTLLKPERREPAHVYLVVARGRLAIVCAMHGIAARGTQGYR